MSLYLFFIRQQQQGRVKHNVIMYHITNIPNTGLFNSKLDNVVHLAQNITFFILLII